MDRFPSTVRDLSLDPVMAVFQEQLEEHRLSAEQWQQHAKQLEQKKVELEQEYLGISSWPSGDTPPKFNSEFTPENGWLEGHDPGSFWEGNNLSGASC